MYYIKIFYTSDVYKKCEFHFFYNLKTNCYLIVRVLMLMLDFFVKQVFGKVFEILESRRYSFVCQKRAF